MNDFQILSKLGEGAYSVVYKAKRLIDGKIYALKKVKLLNLSDKEKQNALNEVRILASVKSSFVISYKEAFFDDTESCLCIVMEYADKGDLYQKISELKNASLLLEESDAWKIFIQMARGLKALHDLKILHRDLKSANIFLFSDGSAKIGDLNVSKVARKGVGYTQTGTPYYASPEVWKDQPYDLKSDIWSLGCVTYEMLTLRTPFSAESMEGLYNKVIKGQYNKINGRYSNDLAEIIKILLQVSPEARPTCDQILKHPIVLKRLEFFKAHGTVDVVEETNLLQTIRIPTNLLFLTKKLPVANYGRTKDKTNTNHSFQNIPLPKVKISSKVKSKERSHNPPHMRIKYNIDHEALEFTVNHNETSAKLRDYLIKQGSCNDKTTSNKCNNNLNQNPVQESNVMNINLKSYEENLPELNIPDIMKNINRLIPSRQKLPKSPEIMTTMTPNLDNADQVYSPYLQNLPLPEGRDIIGLKANGCYSNAKSRNLKVLEKYYYNLYRSKKHVIEQYTNIQPSEVRVIPNRKLSPIGKKIAS